MTTINQLASVDTLSTADQLLLYSTANGDERRTSLNSLLTFINENASPTNLNTKQYASPTTGFSLQIGLMICSFETFMIFRLHIQESSI